MQFSLNPMPQWHNSRSNKQRKETLQTNKPFSSVEVPRKTLENMWTHQSFPHPWMMHCPESTNKQCINYNLTECTQWVLPMFEDMFLWMPNPTEAPMWRRRTNWKWKVSFRFSSPLSLPMSRAANWNPSTALSPLTPWFIHLPVCAFKGEEGMGWIFGNKFSLRTLQRVFATGAFVALGRRTQVPRGTCLNKVVPTYGILTDWQLQTAF